MTQAQHDLADWKNSFDVVPLALS